MEQRSTILPDEAATQAFGQQLAMVLPPRCIVYLSGDLGAGKTTFLRSVIQTLGYEQQVKSPTYSLVETYPTLNPVVYHFDLYRISDAEELEYIGAEDYFTQIACCFVEWPERGAGWLPPCDLHLYFQYHAEGRSVR